MRPRLLSSVCVEEFSRAPVLPLALLLQLTYEAPHACDFARSMISLRPSCSSRGQVCLRLSKQGFKVCMYVCPNPANGILRVDREVSWRIVFFFPTSTSTSTYIIVCTCGTCAVQKLILCVTISRAIAFGTHPGAAVSCHSAGGQSSCTFVQQCYRVYAPIIHPCIAGSLKCTRG